MPPGRRLSFLAALGWVERSLGSAGGRLPQQMTALRKGATLWAADPASSRGFARDDHVLVRHAAPSNLPGQGTLILITGT